MPMGRYQDWEACVVDQMKIHDKDSAEKICGEIKDRAEKGVLLKASDTSLKVLSKAGEEDLVLGGYASWECEDDQGDIFTVEAQSKALVRFLNLPPEYQSVTVNHGLGWAKEFKLAQPLKKYVDSLGKAYYSHVNEIGTFLVSKLRSDDMKATQYYRQKAQSGELTGYSVTAYPLVTEEGNSHRVLDMEYSAITITEKGVTKPVNPKTRDVKVISKSSLSIEEIFEKYGF